MEALRIYKTNNRISDVVSVSYLGVWRIHNRCSTFKETQ
jgi:hypothetical protein